ncbi:sensor histidine kinase [Saccharibacillus qingshengii]|uniref:sensor histidine kinase n=1 Tax=Saccharibacillus qingshengii TaxID=1763540 RepID=UPI001556290D|nr:HAMP domain-containing sensor histidine kinase [Saccharibacillus qingshengii]
MKKKRVPGIRAKFYAAAAVGMVLAGLSIVAVQSLLPSLAGISTAQAAQWEQSYAWIYFAGFVLLALSFASLLTRGLIRRIESIGSAAERIGQGDLTCRIGETSGDELGRLSRRIDGMAEALERADERERSAEEDKNRLIASLSHDMRTPLTSLSGYLEMAELRLKRCGSSPSLKLEESPFSSRGAAAAEEAAALAEALRCIGAARRKTGELEGYADQLLDYTLIGAGDVQAGFVFFALETLLGQVLADFVPGLERAGMKLEKEFRPGTENAEVYGDPALLARLLGNLIDNGIRYGGSGGWLIVRTWLEAGRIVIEIANKGEPIAEEDLPHLFERMYRGDKSRSASRKGRGLGLAAVREIARLHGAEVEVRSDRFETCFTVHVPQSGLRVESVRKP